MARTKLIPTGRGGGSEGQPCEGQSVPLLISFCCIGVAIRDRYHGYSAAPNTRFAAFLVGKAPGKDLPAVQSPCERYLRVFPTKPNAFTHSPSRRMVSMRCRR
jgi:hypothetical protein